MFIVSTYAFLMFGLSEKHSKFEKNLPHGFDKSADLLNKRHNKREIFSNSMVLSQCLNFTALCIQWSNLVWKGPQKIIKQILQLGNFKFNSRKYHIVDEFIR